MTRLGWLLGTSLRGVRARWILSLGSLLLTVIAIASAVLGPSYQHNAANSFVISQLRAQLPLTTGLTYDYQPRRKESIDEAAATALEETNRESGSGYLPGRAFTWQPLPATTGISTSLVLPPSVPTLLSAPGGCQHVDLRGRCPSGAGEVAVLAVDARNTGLHLGSRFNPYGDQTPFVVTGIYRPRDSQPDRNFWFDIGRLQTVPASDKRIAHLAPWLTSQVTVELRRETWHLTVDQFLDTPADRTADQVKAIADRVKAIDVADRHHQLPAGLSLEPGNSLPQVAHQLLDRRGVTRSTVEPAVLSLILVALVLLARLLAAAMTIRRGELALASLRGYDRRQLWFLGMLEPLLIVAMATPLGVVVGYLGSRLLTRRWLVPGLPAPFLLASGLAVLGVVLVTGVVAAIVVRDAVGEPLSAQIAGVRRPTKSRRAVVVMRLAVIALAAAALVTAASRDQPQRPDATDLALPILLAVASGLLVGLLVVTLAGPWVRWSARRRALSSYVASRTVRRRREGTMVIVPLTAALTVAVFAAGVALAASTWRASAAATAVGAPLSFSTALSLPRAVGLTHQVDPQGRWLMAAAEDFPNADEVESVPKPRVVVDSTRLARVASWPTQWTPGRSAAEIASEIGPRRPPVMLRGSTLSMTVDNRVEGDFDELGVVMTVLDDNGALRNIDAGPFPKGRTTRITRLGTCRTGCQIESISFGGPSALVEAMRGSATMEAATVDGRMIPGMLDSSWRPQPPQIASSGKACRSVRLRRGELTMAFRSNGPQSYAGIVPADFPSPVPVLFGRLTSQARQLPTGASGLFRVQSAGAPAESIPFRGPSGILMDFSVFVRNASMSNTDDLVYIWARSDTPQRVLSALSGHGLSSPTSEAETKHVLDQDAFALALRLYLVVTVLVIVLALAGLGANLAVQLPGRRRDAASLRVVGVKRRSVINGVVAEFVVVLGAAALAGVAAGAVAQYVVVRTVTLGFVDSALVPRVVPSFDIGSALTLSAVMLVVLLVAASVFAFLTISGARTSSLRENAR